LQESVIRCVSKLIRQGIDHSSSLLGQHKVPGASLAIIQNGEIVATYGYGVAQPNQPVTPRTRFQAASISKTFNALAVLKLVEASEFRLDDPVNQRLQSWKLPDNALTAATPVTIRMLLNHTGGTNTPGFVGYRPGAPLPTLIEILNGTRGGAGRSVRSFRLADCQVRRPQITAWRRLRPAYRPRLRASGCRDCEADSRYAGEAHLVAGGGHDARPATIPLPRRR
jgi:Beta-lactamase